MLKGETLMKMKRLDDARTVFEEVRKEYGGPFAATAGKFLEEVDELVKQGRPGTPPPEPEPVPGAPPPQVR